MTNDTPIPVSERLPELTYDSKYIQNCKYSDSVLAWDNEEKEWFKVYYVREHYWFDNEYTYYWEQPSDNTDRLQNVTHWLPLPQAPITQEKTQ